MATVDGGVEEAIEIRFDAVVNSQPFDCNSTFQGLGVGSSDVAPLDFRFFVHDVRLRDPKGRELAVTLDADGAFQQEGVALLDFENGSGSCKGGTLETHQALKGRVAAASSYTGLSFTVGVPPSMNHLAAATAAPPLNIPGMWWTWASGYRYLRIDWASLGHPEGYLFHLGGMNCDGTRETGLACEYPNLARVDLSGTNVERVVVDLHALYASIDLDAVNPAAGIAGCMSAVDDPDCPALFNALGLPFAGAEPVAPQKLFVLK